MKKVLLIVIDALSSRHVQRAFKENRLPHLHRLVELGGLREDCISIFPSITPAATASIITGKYPRDHGVPGAFFYDTDEDHVYFFGDDLWTILRKGTGEFFNDFLVRLNEDALSSPTLFETVEHAGLRAACLNYLISKGNQAHPVDVPWLLRLFPGVPWRKEVYGPDLLCLGDLVAGKPRTEDDALSAPGGPFNRFGFQDDSTASFLLELARENAWRDFNIAYFPDNDFDSHSDGPTSAVATLENVDRHLGELFDVCGGAEALLDELAILVTGDHSQSDLVADEEARGIQLDELLAEYPLVKPGGEWTDDEQLMICPNMRAAQIYVRRSPWPEMEQLVLRLLSDRRIDQVIYREETPDGDDRFRVSTAQRGNLTFQPDPDGRGRDEFGNRWCWEGSLDPVDGEVDDQGNLRFPDYPNAFERIATSFIKPAGGDIWVTAAVGHEFQLPGVKIHGGGSHGSLHATDSLSPLIAAGLPPEVKVADPVRTIDVAPLCLRTLNIAQ